ncbi:MAG TPA: hypothetical protein VMB50_08390 [Myxococcales bacterium]|nr:hypothetical protein [Myxococcales bacterium]
MPARRRKYRVPRGALRTPEGPYDRVLGLSHGVSARLAASAVIALCLHVGLVALARFIPPSPQLPVTREIPITVATIQPPPPPPAPPPAPPPEPVRHVQARAAPRAPRPAAAQAGKVIARAPTPSEPLDFTGFDIVTGQSESFAGGFTAANGKSKAAVTNPNASADGVVGGHGTVGHKSLARAPAPSREDWACSWPDDQQESDLRDARVSVRVSVDRDGDPQSVQVVNAPGQSFAEAARRCALGESYDSALDVDGHRVPGTTPLFIVHFVR